MHTLVVLKDPQRMDLEMGRDALLPSPPWGIYREGAKAGGRAARCSCCLVAAAALANAPLVRWRVPSLPAPKALAWLAPLHPLWRWRRVKTSKRTYLAVET
ncbi:hypothetical protein Taro_012660 [Colocasia esculenta]|uniref:Uncharacterized protein n=1 Tax=Colocasia esculenta TaxID=4460 RepID=A0A843U9T4_COLES|nr:hypothetical protein [Colocasia esculenta]